MMTSIYRLCKEPFSKAKGPPSKQLQGSAADGSPSIPAGSHLSMFFSSDFFLFLYYLLFLFCFSLKWILESRDMEMLIATSFECGGGGDHDMMLHGPRWQTFKKYIWVRIIIALLLLYHPLLFLNKKNIFLIL